MNPPKINQSGNSSDISITTVSQTTSSTSGGSLSLAEEMREQAWTARVKDEQQRLRKCILSLRSQVKNPSIMDSFLSCLSTVTAIDGRLPFTPKKVVTVQDKAMLVHNLAAHAIIDWGILARKEGEPTCDRLVELENVVQIGFANIWAYPRERNSAIYVLRTLAEEKALHADRAAANEKALEMKSKIRSGGLSVEDKEKPE